MAVIKIANPAKEIIEEYKRLNLGDKNVVCPYYMNTRGNKDLRAMVGKGTPEEIILEAKIWEKVKGVSFKSMKPAEIKEFLLERGIGIDCSGFVVHVLNEWYRSETGNSIWNQFKIPQNNILRKLAYWLKPVEKLGANIITNKDNAVAISIKQTLPGDVIRLKWKKKNSHHILLVTEVTKDKSGTVTALTYNHSIPLYNKLSGVKEGKIQITNPEKALEEQDWLEKDENGVGHTLEGYLIQKDDNGLRRINALSEMIQNQVSM